GSIGAMAPHQGLGLASPAARGRREVSDGLAATDDRELLAPVLHRVEEVGEVACCVRGGHIRHCIRSSDVAVGYRSVVSARSSGGHTVSSLGQHLRRIRGQLVSGYWFIPATVVATGSAAAVGLLLLDDQLDRDGDPLGFTGGPD